MEVERELRRFRNLVYAIALFTLCAVTILMRVVMLTGRGRLLADGSDAPAHVDRILGKPPNMWELREALSQTAES